VHTKNSKDLREAIAQRLISGGFGVRRLERKASLRDYFFDLMGERAAPAPAASEPTAPPPPAEAIQA
jgi:hypothetical protein